MLLLALASFQQLTRYESQAALTQFAELIRFSQTAKMLERYRFAMIANGERVCL